MDADGQRLVWASSRNGTQPRQINIPLGDSVE
jgi:hypothetical protein